MRASGAWDCCRSAFLRVVHHGRHCEPIENGYRDVTCVVESVDNDDEIELGNCEETLAAAAKASSPSQFMTIEQRTAKPPMVSIVLPRTLPRSCTGASTRRSI